MSRKRKSSSHLKLLEAHLSALTVFVKDLAPESRVEISYAQYEDEDAHVSIHLPETAGEDEVQRVETALGERCNDILVDTGLFIIGAVGDQTCLLLAFQRCLRILPTMRGTMRKRGK